MEIHIICGTVHGVHELNQNFFLYLERVDEPLAVPDQDDGFGWVEGDVIQPRLTLRNNGLRT